ncbi:MAG: hypothetical protein IK116_03755 [Firmicutes bacterium]|nr:hypothetical protein [Bacillota bacterium]
MKEFDLNGISYLQQLRYGTDEWYYALDHPQGDLYEAEELYAAGRPVRGNDLFLIHYPDGEVVRPLTRRDDTVIGEPVYHDQWISFPAVDFAGGSIRIYRFNCRRRSLTEAAELPLGSVRDCYNLRLHEHPLTLSRQANDGTLELIWPERKDIAISPRESFFYREENKLFFNDWYEDPDYREETVIRDAATGEVLQRLPGDIHIMPNGEVWHLK